MHNFIIYYENADTDDPRKPLGQMQANTMAEALQKASEFWEVPSHDLVAEQTTKNVVFNPLKRNDNRLS